MYLYAALWVVILFGITAIIFTTRGFPFLGSVYAGLIALVFSMFLVYDTQQIMGGRKYEIHPEEHVFAAICLYMDVINIFLAILRLGRN